MQDNYQHEFDEQFVNQAWSQMRQLLDREMPVAGKRRPLFWLWWLAGTLALALLGWGIYAYSHQQPGPAAENTLQPAVVLEMAGQNPGSQSTAASTAEKGSTEREGPANTGSQSGPAVVAPPTPLPGSIVHPTSPDPDCVQPLQQASNAATSEQATASRPVKAPTSIPNQEIKPAEAPAPSPMKVPSPLPARRVWPMQEFPARFTAGLSTPAASSTSNFRLAAEAGAGTHSFSSLDAYHAGLAAELHIPQSRFYLRSGLHYRIFNRNLTYSSRLLALENSGWPQSGPVSNISYLSATSTVTQAQYLSLPLTIGFKAWPRLAVETGLQASFLATSRQNDHWSLAGNSSLPQGSGVDAALYRSASRSADEELQNTSFEIQAGLAYFPTQTLGLRLQYQYGLTDLLLTPSREAYHRGLQFSFAYYMLR